MIEESSPAGTGLLSGRTSHDADGLYGADAPHQKAVERVIVAMRDQANGALPLDAMAEIAHLSPYHFARTFRRVTGIPPGEFLSALRLERAKELLLTTDLSVTEVCFEVGYNSPGTFTTRFTRLVGLPPGRLRRLPEEAALAFENLCGRDPLPPPETGVAFRIFGSDLAGALIFAGLFPGAIPQCKPVAGAVLTAPGDYRLEPVPDGSYHLMAAALPYSDDPLGYLLPGVGLRVGRAQGPVVVQDGRCEGRAEIVMRPPLTIDPPVLLALFASLLETAR